MPQINLKSFIEGQDNKEKNVHNSEPLSTTLKLCISDELNTSIRCQNIVTHMKEGMYPRGCHKQYFRDILERDLEDFSLDP